MALEKIDLGTGPDTGTGDSLFAGAAKLNNNVDETVGTDAENVFTKKQTVKAPTNNGSTAFEIRNSLDVVVTQETDEGHRIGKGLIQSKSFVSDQATTIVNSNYPNYALTDLQLAITPKSATSKLRARITSQFYCPAGQSGVKVRMQYSMDGGTVWNDILSGNQDYLAGARVVTGAINPYLPISAETQINSPGTTTELLFRVIFAGFANANVEYARDGQRLLIVDEVQE